MQTVTVSTHAEVVAPTEVSISGPATGSPGAFYTFTATVSPATSTRPLTYTWTATGKTVVIRSSGLSDTLTLAWPTGGSKMITVTAENAAGAVSDMHTLTLEQRIYLPLVMRNQ